MEVLVLETIHQSDAFYRKEREHHHIQNFDLVRKGLNGKNFVTLQIAIIFKNFTTTSTIEN